MKKSILFLLAIPISIAFQLHAQRVLTESETGFIAQAKSQLANALSNPDMSDAQRVAVFKRSAVTLKEYCQPTAWPEGEIPLSVWMNGQHQQCEDEIVSLSDIVLKMTDKTLDQKMKLINTMQLEVIDNQIQMFVPGLTPIQLASDVVSTVFEINFAEGVTGGKRKDAKDLVDRFKKLAADGKLLEHFKILLENHRKSLRLIDKDIIDLNSKIPKWETAYYNAADGAFCMEGLEGAVPNTAEKQQPTNSIVGEWRFGYKEIGYFHLTFKPNGEYVFEDKMNKDSDTRIGTYSVSGNLLQLMNPSSSCGKTAGNYYFKIEDYSMRFSKIEDMCLERKLTFNHVWEK